MLNEATPVEVSPMTIKELLDLANTAYDSAYLEVYYDQNGNYRQGKGDTLAEFIVLELQETFDPKATKKKQLQEAARVIENARYQLQDLQDRLESEL
jgi:hypothetical protein